MIKLIDKQADVIVECETRTQALKYVSDYNLCVWEMNGNEWEVRPRKEMFKGLNCIAY